MKELTTVPGLPLQGGYYAGRILIAATPYAIIVAPKAEGEHDDIAWIARNKNVPLACSYNDSMANTLAMADAGSQLAQWALDLRIGGHSDWCIGAQDVMEIAYRNLKPTTDENSCWARSGINVSADPPTYPHRPDFPRQTENELFRAGGIEAFEPAAYWTSTQYASVSGLAWTQNFHDGDQLLWLKGSLNRARAVRLIKLDEIPR